MGASDSKHGGQVISQAAQLPPEPLYPGPSAQYHFVNVNVSMTAQVNFSFFSGSMMCSNIDTYYPALAEQYSKGFRMLTFYHIPGQVKQAGGLFSPSVLMPFQGIFCRYPEAQPSNERYQLYIEKSVIQPEIVWNGFLTTNTQTVTNTSHLFQTIINNAAKGARLICIELTGQEQHQQTFALRQTMPMKGCDIFFEMPLHPPQETYIYNVVSVPIHVTWKHGFVPRPVVQCNWHGVLEANLGQGWRLVEIFMDEGQASQTRGFTPQQQLNSQWYFEKPASRISDPTPVYQGTIVEHEIIISQTFGGAKTHANWEGIMQNMGNKGWELACLLETPDQHASGFGSVKMKVLLFFQRKIVPDNSYAMPQPQSQPLSAMPYPGKSDALPGPVAQGSPYPGAVGATAPPASVPPPSYDSLASDPNYRTPHSS